jgi:hypothetical protein
VEEDFLGVPMFFRSYLDDETRELLRAAGFELERVQVVPIDEPEGPASFLWVLARTGGCAPGRRGARRYAGSRTGRSPRTSCTAAPAKARMTSPVSASPKMNFLRLIRS